MSHDLKAPEPTSVEFAQEPVPTMANQNMPSNSQEERRVMEHDKDEVEEGWIDGRRSSQRIQMQLQRKHEESDPRPGPLGLQPMQGDFINYRSALRNEAMTSSDESQKRRIKAQPFNLDDLSSDLTDTDASESNRCKTPTSPKVTRAFRQLDIAYKSPSKRRQGELFEHINRLTFEEKEILRSNTNAAREDITGQ